MTSMLPHILFLFLLPCFAVAQTNGTISVGTTLTATDEATSWLSPLEDFAFGFHDLENSDLFFLSIWYAKIPVKTIVWYASEANPVPRGSKLELIADRGLVLKDPQDKELWTTGISTGAVTYGFMNDTGNFVLKNRTSDAVWESFKSPTDTILPTQIIEKGGLLSSRQSDSNFSRGKFQLRLLPEGQLVLNTINMQTNYSYGPYYRSTDSNPSNFGYQVVFNELGYLYILRENNSRVDLTRVVVPSSNFYHRATLNIDGVFTQYYYPKASTANANWTIVRNTPQNICNTIAGDTSKGLGTVACGYNSICMLSVDQRPNCKCPQGFSLLDPKNEYGSCKSDFIQGCDEEVLSSTENLYDFHELTNTDWPTSDYELLTPYNGEDCKKACSNDCLCTVAVFGGDECWKKKLPLSFGREDRALNKKVLLKVRKGNSTPQNPFSPIPTTKKKQDTLVLVVSVLLGSSVFVNFLLVSVICVGIFFIYPNKLTSISSQNGTSIETNLKYFTYKELQEATNAFRDELGRGSFGVVYKGVIEKKTSTPRLVRGILVGINNPPGFWLVF